VAYVADDRPFQGPLSGLATGLRVASSEIVLAVGGDMPALHPGILALLAGRARRGIAVALEEAGSIRPLPIALARGPALRAAEELLAARAPRQRSLRAFLETLGATAIPESEWLAIDPRADSLLDVDTRADLDRLRERA
jgi:molybdopterin-guanine dinucleotide biosynthesis protein A